jgi:hypothetical protein
VRFVELLKATVMLSAAAATALAALTALVASAGAHYEALFASAAWWLVAAVLGAWLGRRAEASAAIARLLAAARVSTTLPELRPGRVLLNRLWPLALLTVAAGALAVVAAQISGIAAGFAVIWALSWRRQPTSVAAIERRDGVAFYVESTSPLKPISLLRTPGLRAVQPEQLNGALR